MDTDFLRDLLTKRPLLEEEADALAFSSSPSLLLPPREFSDSKDTDFLIKLVGKEEDCLALSLVVVVEMIRVASLASAVWSCSTLFRLATCCSSPSHMLSQLGRKDVRRVVVEEPLMLFGSAGRECIRFSGEKT